MSNKKISKLLTGVVASLLLFISIYLIINRLKVSDREYQCNNSSAPEFIVEIKDTSTSISNIAFFENCSFNLDSMGTGYNAQESVKFIEPKLHQLRTIADSINSPLMYTNCLCGNNMLQTKGNIIDGVFIDIEKDTVLDSIIKISNHYYIHKINYFSKGKNLEHKGYEVFRVNKNLPELIHKLKIKQVIVYGNSLDYCIFSTSLGFLNEGVKTIILRDVTGKCHGDIEAREKIFTQLKEKGAMIMTFDQFKIYLSII